MHVKRRRGAGAVVLGGALVASAALAQPMPLGGEFQVNAYTTGTQAAPSVIADPSSGNFLVVFSSGRPEGPDVTSRLLGPDGVPLGPQQGLSNETFATESAARGASDGAEFLVIWGDLSGRDGDDYGVFARRVNADGTPLATDFSVAAHTTGDQTSPAITPVGDGSFMATWRSCCGLDGDRGAVRSRVIEAGGPSGIEQTVNTEGEGDQNYMALAPGFATWWSASTGSRGRLLDALGPVGPEITIYEGNGAAELARIPGGYIAVWSNSEVTGFPDVIGRIVEEGVPSVVTDPFVVNESTSRSERAVRVASSPGGEQLTVVWESVAGGNGIFARAFDSPDTTLPEPIGGDFKVNMETLGTHGHADVAMSENRIMIVWTSCCDQDGSNYGVFGRVYRQTVFQSNFEDGTFAGWSEVVP